jgi:hypothetical protein
MQNAKSHPYSGMSNTKMDTNMSTILSQKEKIRQLKLEN